MSKLTSLNLARNNTWRLTGRTPQLIDPGHCKYLQTERKSLRCLAHPRVSLHGLQSLHCASRIQLRRADGVSPSRCSCMIARNDLDWKSGEKNSKCICIKGFIPVVIISKAMSFSLPQRAASILCIALIIGSCFSSPTAKPAILRAIHSAEYDRSSDLRARDSDRYPELDLQTQGKLMYGGSPGMRTALR